MPEFLEYGFMHRAFVAGAITALICPAIGVFLVPRRLSLIADSLSHVALAGVALGLLIGVSPVLGALVVTVAGAVGMERLRARGALGGDAALAVFLSGGFALAVVLISLAGGFNADLFAILFGSILTVSPTDVSLILGLGAVVGVTIGTFYRQLLAITLNDYCRITFPLVGKLGGDLRRCPRLGFKGGVALLNTLVVDGGNGGGVSEPCQPHRGVVEIAHDVLSCPSTCFSAVSRRPVDR